MSQLYNDFSVYRPKYLCLQVQLVHVTSTHESFVAVEQELCCTFKVDPGVVLSCREHSFFYKNEVCRCEITKSYIKSKKDKQSYKIKSKIIIYFKSPWSLLELNNANTILSMALTSHLYKKGSLGCQIVLKFTKVSKIAKV